eukprot:scaffold6724_cov67-Skeletonema_dohrnii-CCMP3373.AAC.1
MPFPETQKRHVECLEEDSFDVPGDPWSRKRPNLCSSAVDRRGQKTLQQRRTRMQPTTEHNLERGRCKMKPWLLDQFLFHVQAL